MCNKIILSLIFSGDMMVSFPAGIVQVVANNPNPAQLSFKIRNASVFESIVPNLKLVTPSELLSTPDGKVFEFKMDALKELLKVQSEMNPNAAYFNIDLLKYQVRYFLYFYFCTCWSAFYGKQVWWKEENLKGVKCQSFKSAWGKRIFTSFWIPTTS